KTVTKVVRVSRAKRDTGRAVAPEGEGAMIVRRLAGFVLVGVVSVNAGCGDSNVSTASSVREVISDQAHGGARGFFWLPPMVWRQPRIEGTFDRDYSPIVRIDEVDSAGNTLSTLATYTAKVRGQAFVAKWPTRLFDLRMGSVYRIRVLLEG